MQHGELMSCTMWAPSWKSLGLDLRTRAVTTSPSLAVLGHATWLCTGRLKIPIEGIEEYRGNLWIYDIYELSFLRFQCVATVLLPQLMCAGTSLRMAFIGVVGCLPSTTETKMRHLFSASYPVAGGERFGAMGTQWYPYDSLLFQIPSHSLLKMGIY